MRASYASMLLVLIVSLIPAGLNAAGFSLPLISRQQGLKYRSDGFFGYTLPPTGGGDEMNLTAVIRPPMAVYGWSYAVQVGVGTGQGRHFYMLELDLVGGLTWMQCEPVIPDLPQVSPIFDSSMSPSYVHVDARRCQAPYTPVGPDRCSFKTAFQDASAHGYLGIDVFSFASGNTMETIPGTTFGCAHTTAGFQNHGTLAGVLSMNRQPTSFINQLAVRHGVWRFSYCLVGRNGNRHSFLRFGDDIPHPANTRETAMMYYWHRDDVSTYRIRVVGVILDGRKLTDIKAGMFQPRNHGVHGCLIDTGMFQSRLIQGAYDILECEVAALLQRHGAHSAAVPGQRLCFQDTPEVRAHLPSMALELYGGTHFDIKPELLFAVVSQGNTRYFCLAIVPDQHQTVLGAMQQVNTQFTFDLRANRIFFAPQQCYTSRC